MDVAARAHLARRQERVHPVERGHVVWVLRRDEGMQRLPLDRFRVVAEDLLEGVEGGDPAHLGAGGVADESVQTHWAAAVSDPC